MRNFNALGRLRSSLRARGRDQTASGQAGQALLETVLSTGFLVAMAIALNRMLRPVLVEAFEKISSALSAVGP